MKNTIKDYLQWRGDLSPIEYPFTDVDYLILSELAYVHLDEVISSSQFHSLTIKEAHKKYDQIYGDHAPYPFFNESHHLFKEAAKSTRYQNIKIIHFVNDIDKDFIKQFSAITFLLENQTIFVAYRGTDDSLIGWHEDFLMLCEKVIPSQISSVNYLHYIAQYRYQESLLQSLKNKHLGTLTQRFIKHFQYKKELSIILAGHSKGGNLAMYAGCFIKEKIRNRILKIYNFDGPGFQDEIISSSQYQQTLPKIISYIPHYSFFGIVLSHEEEYQTVHSLATGMFQHNAFTWSVTKDGFVKDELSYESVQFAIKVLLFLKDLSYQEKKEFVNAMFGLFDSLELYTFTDLSHITYKQILAGLKELTSIQSHIRKMLIEVLHMLWLEAKKAKMPS